MIFPFFIDRSASVAGCPRAVFEFFNGTVRAPYNFAESPVGNIGSSETCPCELNRISIAIGKPIGLDTGRPYLYLPCYPNSTWGYHEPYFSMCSKSDQTMKIFTSTYKPNPYVNLEIGEVAQVKAIDGGKTEREREPSEFRLVTNEQHRGDQSRVRLFERSTTNVSIVERRRVSGENSRSNERSDGQSEAMRRTTVETFFFFSAESVADLSDRR